MTTRVQHKERGAAYKTFTCRCGIAFELAPWQQKRGKGRHFCSVKCRQDYFREEVRPGLKSVGPKASPTHIKPGQRLSPKTEFQKGQAAHNFSGDQVGYDALHDWVKRHNGKAQRCEHCGSSENVQWANRSGRYERDMSDWLQLCYGCHRRFDHENHWGSGVAVFPLNERGRYGRRAK